MKIISINTLCGLHNMLYDKKNLNTNKKTDVENNFLDINNLFWSQVLSHETISNTINYFIQISSILGTLSIQEQYVVSAPNIFIDKLTEAKNNIINTETDERTLFSYIETLNIFCMIYSRLLPTNFTFTIDQGFHRSSSSAKEMLEHCLLEYSNPYLNFITQTVLPIILDLKPDIIFMKGIPNIGSFAIAKLVKQKLPKVHISITNHSTEYYSINKIKNNLLANAFFFECFDSVVLNQNYTETEKEIVNSLSRNSTLSDVPNILYKNQNGSVNVTNIKITYPKYDFNMNNILKEYVNIRLFPKNHCYWNQCTFCGINNKYLDYSTTWNIEDAWCQINYLQNKNINYFWSIDEAIPPSVLYQLAQKMNKNNCNFVWHTRSRLDSEWINEDIIKELAVSGLTQIRLGFESASIRILKLMNKHENVEEVMNNIELILELFFKYQIRVHFPAIIGFPTETIYEREQTINYLKKLKKKYPLFSYNVNILELDISSKLYKNWDKYNITQINLPCPLNDFMGNIIKWYEPIVHSTIPDLEQDRRNTMLSQYDWYPENALTEPHIFYRLYESGRYMLYNTKIHDAVKVEYNYKNFIIKKFPDLISWKTQLGTYITYNPRNHHFYECSASVHNLFNEENILIDDMSYFPLIKGLLQNKFIYICEGR